MRRHVWLALAGCAALMVVFLIFYGWRQGAMSLLPVKMMFCLL